MRSMVAVALIALSAAPALAACPPGAYAWLGRGGVEYCRRNIVEPRGRRRSMPRGHARCDRRSGRAHLREDQAGAVEILVRHPPVLITRPRTAARCVP